MAVDLGWEVNHQCPAMKPVLKNLEQTHKEFISLSKKNYSPLQFQSTQNSIDNLL